MQLIITVPRMMKIKNYIKQMINSRQPNKTMFRCNRINQSSNIVKKKQFSKTNTKQVYHA